MHVNVYIPRFSHITSVIKSLNWLKVKERIEYKLLSLTYKVLTTSQPSEPTYLSHSTRSSSVVTISRPPTSSSLKITNRFFFNTAPHFWNKLLTLSVSLIQFLVFRLLTTLHKSDTHCHHHLCHHQSLLFSL